MAEIHIPELSRPYALIEAENETSPLEIGPERIIDLYKEHGALLLRGFNIDLDSFRTFAQHFCSSSVFNESPDRKLLDDANNIQSVNGGDRAFPLHPELSREPWKPDACFFCCINPPSAGGMTTICDGIELVRQLPLPVRRVFEGRRLLYIQQASPQALQFWLGTPTPDEDRLSAPPPHCPYVFRRNGQTVFRIFSRPALHKPMFAEGPAFGNFLLFARYYNGRPNFPLLDDGMPVPPAAMEVVRQVGDRLSAAIAWRKGDLLMLDNTRFMHGRTAIKNTDERLIASYFGYLNFAVQSPEEPADAPWRVGTFRPPAAGIRTQPAA